MTINEIKNYLILKSCPNIINQKELAILIGKSESYIKRVKNKKIGALKSISKTTFALEDVAKFIAQNQDSIQIMKENTK